MKLRKTLVFIGMVCFVNILPFAKIIFCQSKLASNITSDTFSLVKEVSKINEISLMWKFQRNNLDLPSEIESSFFLNEKDWWLAIKAGILSTNNRGLTWDKWQLNLKNDEKVEKLFFVNEHIGWMVIQPEPIDSILNYQCNYYRLLKTVDGGKTWNLQNTNKNVLVSDLGFSDENNGWIVGINYLGISPVKYTYFLQKTIDGGRTWVDMSEELKSFNSYKIDLNKYHGNDALEVISLSNDGNINTASGKGIVFSSSDKGIKWNTAGAFEGRIENSSIFKISKESPDSNFWMAEHSNHHGFLISSLIIKDNSTWSLNLLPNIYLLDIIKTESKTYFASGYRIEAGKGNNIYNGVVLKTSDNGRNWSVLFKISDDKIQMIHPLSQKSLLIIMKKNGIGVLTPEESSKKQTQL